MSTATLDTRELKSAFARFTAENDQIVATAPIVDGVVQIDTARLTAFQKNMQSLGEIKALLDYAEIKAWGDQPAGQSVAAQLAAGAPGAFAAGASSKSIGAAFCESPEFKAMRQANRFTMDSPFNVTGVDLGSLVKGLPFSGIEQKDVYTGLPTGAIASGFAPRVREDMVLRPYRKVRVRDLFPAQPTTAALIEYFRVTGFSGLSAAAPVAERAAGAFALKPQTTLSFVGVQSPVRTVAHWEAAHRNTLDDVPQLQGIIENELLYGLRLREDDQILNGDGTGENLLGILNAGIQTYTRPGSGMPANENHADDIRRAATKVLLSYYEPTGIVMHPGDWEGIELLKDSTGAYIVAVAVALGGEQRLWRLPVVDTPAIAQGTAIVGAFGLGGKLYDRQEGNIRIAEQHADFFLRNAVVVLAEQRLALTVPRPESFVKVTLD